MSNDKTGDANVDAANRTRKPTGVDGRTDHVGFIRADFSHAIGHGPSLDLVDRNGVLISTNPDYHGLVDQVRSDTVLKPHGEEN